jgi:CRP-like cAMP-binding protein
LLIDSSEILASCGKVLGIRKKFRRKMMGQEEIEEIESIARSLKQFDFFKNLPDEAIYDLVDKVEHVKLKKGDVLFNKGEKGDALYILQEGWVKMVVEDKSGSEIVINQVGPGNVIGEMALIEDQPRSAGVVALNEAKLLKLTEEEFMDVFMSQPLLGLEISRTMAQRLRFTTTYIESAIEWSKQIAAGNYDYVEEQTNIEGATIIGPSRSDQERALRFLGTFFSMVKDIKAREESLKEELTKLKVVIDEHKRQQDVSELASSEFFRSLKESSGVVRREQVSKKKKKKK